MLAFGTNRCNLPSSVKKSGFGTMGFEPLLTVLMVAVAAFVIGAAATAAAFAVMVVVMMIASAFFGGGERTLQEGVDGLVGVAAHAC